MLRTLIRKVLLNIGYELRPLGRRGWHPVYLHVEGELARFERPRWDPTYIRTLGFSPATIVDVGVAGGTPSLYDAFPDAELVLIEPQSECEDELRGILKHRHGSYHLVAVGDREGTATLFVDPERERSSLENRVGPELDDRTLHPRQVRLTTLDTLLEGLRPSTPYGLKLDVEGAELAVLRGATEVLRQTEFVIAEVPLIERYSDGYLFSEIVALLANAGFELRDVLDIGRALSGRKTGEATFVDAVFDRRPSRV